MITSRQHPVVTRFKHLATHVGDGHALLDGDHLVADALDAGVPLEVVLGDQHARPLLSRAAASGAVVHEGSAAVLGAARPVRGTSGGVVAIARWSPRSLDVVFGGSPQFVLALVDVQDPGNLGSAIRSADALGASAVIALGESANPAGWKALRGAMGSSFRVTVGRGDLDEALRLARRGQMAVAATALDGGLAIDNVDFTRPTLVLVGNEGAGLDASVIARAETRLTIPMRPGTNSLNVAVTAALVLWERQRQVRARRITP